MESSSYSWLKDFDWSVRLVLSSDKVSGLRRPVLMIKIDTINPDGSVQDTLIELDAESAGSLLQTLKMAQSVSNTKPNPSF